MSILKNKHQLRNQVIDCLEAITADSSEAKAYLKDCIQILKQNELIKQNSTDEQEVVYFLANLFAIKYPTLMTEENRKPIINLLEKMSLFKDIEVSFQPHKKSR